MADLRRRPPQKAISVSKICFFLLGVLSTGVAALLAVPPAASVLASALPRIWASLCSWLVPPYLFIVIHLIILVLWKLSDHKQQHRDPWAVEERPPEDVGAAKVKTFEHSPTEPLPPEPPLETWGEILPPSETAPAVVLDSAAPQPSDACAKELEENSVASSAFEINANVEPPTESEDVLEEPAAEEERAVENDSMEATWKAIMEKTSRGKQKPAAQEPRPPEAVAIRWREPSVTGREQLNRRFDDFIKKYYDQIRLQRHESNQRRLQMVNAGSY